MMPQEATRLAPSPTGRMHLGHAWSFLCAWGLAREHGWRIVLRMEDLDASRVSAEAERDTLWMLQWLGIDWDGPIERQSQRRQDYRSRMQELAASGCVFEAPHSRAQLRAAQNPTSAEDARAPNEGDAVVCFPAALRPAADAWRFTDEQTNHRLALADERVEVVDELCGTRSFNPSSTWGDPLVWLKSGVPSYQLAVVVDDIAMGITDVVRGEDLHESAGLQQVIRTRLGATRPPRWWHLPLVRDENGKRLAKRHDALALATLAAQGATPERVRGLVAFWAGATPSCEPMSIDSMRRLNWSVLLKTRAARPLTVSGLLLRWTTDR